MCVWVLPLFGFQYKYFHYYLLEIDYRVVPENQNLSTLLVKKCSHSQVRNKNELSWQHCGVRARARNVKPSNLYKEDVGRTHFNNDICLAYLVRLLSLFLSQILSRVAQNGFLPDSLPIGKLSKLPINSNVKNAILIPMLTYQKSVLTDLNKQFSLLTPSLSNWRSKSQHGRFCGHSLSNFQIWCIFYLTSLVDTQYKQTIEFSLIFWRWIQQNHYILNWVCVEQTTCLYPSLRHIEELLLNKHVMKSLKTACFQM